MSIYLSIMDKVNKFLKVLVFLLLFTSMISLFLQVIFRFVIDFPISWANELSRYLMVWLTFIGASLAARNNGLIKLEVLLNIIPANYQKIIGFVAGIIVFLFLFMLIYYGISILETVNMQTSPALHISMAIPYSAIPIGGILMFCNTLASLFDNKMGANIS